MEIRENHELVSYILYQRTEFLRFGGIYVLKRLLPYHFLVDLDARLFSKKVVKEYERDIQKEWENILPFLPESASRSLDIGCGVGLINSHIYHRYGAQGRPMDVYLVDRDALAERIYYEFEPEGSPYNSLDYSSRFLQHKGVPKESIHTINVEKDALPQGIKFDLVLSLLSWAYHYPLSTYLDYVRSHLSPEGVLIIDCNVRTTALAVLRQDFDITIIKTEPTYQRVCAKLKPQGLSH